MFHQRMFCAFCPVDIKFLFEEFIDGGVEGKRESGWLGDPQSPVQIKTAGAIDEVIYPASA